MMWIVDWQEKFLFTFFGSPSHSSSVKALLCPMWLDFFSNFCQTTLLISAAAQPINQNIWIQHGVWSVTHLDHPTILLLKQGSWDLQTKYFLSIWWNNSRDDTGLQV